MNISFRRPLVVLLLSVAQGRLAAAVDNEKPLPRLLGSDGGDDCLSVHNRTATLYRFLSLVSDTPLFPEAPFYDALTIVAETTDNEKFKLDIQDTGTYVGVEDVAEYLLLSKAEFNGNEFDYISNAILNHSCTNENEGTISTSETIIVDGEEVEWVSTKKFSFVPGSGRLLSYLLDDFGGSKYLSLEFSPRDLCDQAIFACPHSLYPYDSLQECYDFTSTLPILCNSDKPEDGLLMGNTVGCRYKHLLLSILNPIVHCPHLNMTSKKCIPEDCSLMPLSEPVPPTEVKAGFPTWLRAIDIAVVIMVAVIPFITYSAYWRASRKVVRLKKEGTGRQGPTESCSCSDIEEEKGGLATYDSSVILNTCFPVIRIQGMELRWSKKFRPRSTQAQIIKTDPFILGGCQLTAIMGRSGTGKSTLIKLLSGFKVPHMKLTYEKYQKRPQIGYCSQSPDIWPKQMKVRDIILFSCCMFDSDTADFIAVFQGLGILHLFDMDFGLLSGGEQQRVHMASAICRKIPTIIFLDEPFASLDAESQLECLKMLKSLPTPHSYCIVAHQLSPKADAQFDRVINLPYDDKWDSNNEQEVDDHQHLFASSHQAFVCQLGLESSGTSSLGKTLPQSKSKKGPTNGTQWPGFWCGFKAAIVLWHSQFFGLPLIEIGTACISIVGAVFFGVLTRETFTSPLPTEYGMRTGNFIAFIVMSVSFITSFCYSLVFSPRERPLVLNLVAQKVLSSCSYTAAVLVRTFFYGFFQALLWMYIVLPIMGIFDTRSASDLMFNLTFYTACWSAVTFTAGFVASFMASHVVIVLICGVLFLSGIVTPWSTLPRYMQLFHYPNPTFQMITAVQNYFFANVLETNCGNLDHFSVCTSSARLAEMLAVEPIYSPLAQAYSVLVGALSFATLWIYLRRSSKCWPDVSVGTKKENKI